MPKMQEPGQTLPVAATEAVGIEKPAHTPLPWTTEAKPHCAWIARIGNNEDDPEIWSATPTEAGKPYVFGDKKADAALIVRAATPTPIS